MPQSLNRLHLVWVFLAHAHYPIFVYRSYSSWVHAGVTLLHDIQSSPFAPIPTNRAEVCSVTWHWIAHNFRATTRARLTSRNAATRLDAADVRLAPLLAARTGENRELLLNERWSPVTVKRLKLNLNTIPVRRWLFRIQWSSYLTWGATSAAMSRKDYAAEKGNGRT